MFPPGFLTKPLPLLTKPLHLLSKPLFPAGFLFPPGFLTKTKPLPHVTKPLLLLTKPLALLPVQHMSPVVFPPGFTRKVIDKQVRINPHALLRFS